MQNSPFVKRVWGVRTILVLRNATKRVMCMFKKGNESPLLSEANKRNAPNLLNASR